MNIIKVEYKERRDKLKETYRAAYDFLKDIEDLNESGFYVQTSKNLHLFLEQNFLFYFKILTPTTIQLRATPNGPIRKYDNQSEYFFLLLLENIRKEELEEDIELERNKTNKISLNISKSIKADKVFEIIKQTIENISQKVDFIESEKQILQILDEFQIQNRVDNEMFSEGLKRNITTTYYERNPKARKKCLEHWGFNCSVCGFNFEEVYGKVGAEYIHVHHLNPVSEIKKEYQIDPIENLRPVCANCHSMLHRKENLLTINELKEMIKTTNR